MLLRIEDIDTARCRPEYRGRDLRGSRLARTDNGSSRCGGNPSIWSDYKAALGQARRAWASSIRASKAAPRSTSSSPRAKPAAAGRAIRTARRFIRARAKRSRRRSAKRGWRRASLTRFVSTWRRRWRASGHLSWREGEEGSILADPAAWGDVVLARKDAPTSYHLSVVVDDALQGVTHVARGRDLYPSTSVHRLLQELLGLPAPFYRHHRLILDSDGRKLAKSNRSTAIRELRAAGATPSDIRRMTGLGLGGFGRQSGPWHGCRHENHASRSDQRKPRRGARAKRRKPSRVRKSLRFAKNATTRPRPRSPRSRTISAPR